MHTTNRTITSTRAIQSVFAGLFVVTLILFAAGCSAAGTDGEGDGEDGGDDGEGADTTAPAAPSGLEGTSKDSAIEITWNSVDADDLDGYNVYRSTSTIEGVSDMSPENGSLLSETNYPDQSAENGTTYHYVVTAVDTAGNASEPSNSVEKTPFSGPPDRPQ